MPSGCPFHHLLPGLLALAVVLPAAPAAPLSTAPPGLATPVATSPAVALRARAAPVPGGPGATGPAGTGPAGTGSAGGVPARPATAGADSGPPQSQLQRSEPPLRCSAQAGLPGTLALALGKSTMVRLPEPVQNRSVGNPAVLQAMLVAPDTLYVAAADIGSTNMIVQGRSGVCSVIEVTVGLDPAGLQAALAELMPDQKGVRVTAAADALVLSGTVDDGETVDRVMELAAAFVRRPARALALHKGEEAPVANAASGVGAATPRLVNLMGVSAPQQVMLEVKIAEVSKTLLDRLELNTGISFGFGSWTGALLSNFLSGTARGALSLARADGKQVTLNAEKQDGLIRILAEPNVMAVSGQEGSFLAGGKIFVPVSQDNNKVTLEEKEYGIGLRFTPTVLAGGRINLRVAPEVSGLSREGVGLTAAGISAGSVLPLITTRRAATTLQLYDGQSFAIGGLLKNNQTTNIHALPILGELPVLGALFRSTDFQHERSELLFVVTARLVQPLPPGYALPTDAAAPPQRAALFLGGRMEGRAADKEKQP